ncbi:MAG: beta-galactosidase [Actinomycetota bacterium]
MTRSWPAVPPGLAYGADYNPEQWPEHVWAEDRALLQAAGVNLLSVGIFAWARLEPAPGRYDFGWLDRVLDGLHEAGVAVDLATPTAAPPAWFFQAHPEALPVAADGTRRWPGSRQTFCPSSPAYRTAAVGIARALAERYAEHPALVLWHVHNEYGCHNAHCYCDTSAAAFRRWLQRRYGDLDRLNAAWGTAFWGQHYGDWAQILPPRATGTFGNPTQQLDFARFSSDELRDCLRAEAAVLREVTPDVPVTTNFMLPSFKHLDYFAWAGEVDVVSNDHYLRAEDPDRHVDLALGADVTRGVAGGGPWLLMEHSTSAVNWQPRNVAKQPGEMLRNSLAHVARGADGVCFFQWRASRAGAEKFHSAMVPHAGTDTKVWREVVALGAGLRRLAEVPGSVVDAAVALLWDWPAWWAMELPAHPSVDRDYLGEVRRQHAALWRAGVTVDVRPPEADLSAYRLVLVPSLYLVTDAAAANLRRFVAGGGHALVTYFSGIVDEHDHIRLGGYPGAFRDLLGVRVEEFFPLPAGSTVRLDDGAQADQWTERVHLAGAAAVARYADGPVAGGPAVTRHPVGDGATQGAVWYLSTRLAAPALADLLARVTREAGVAPAAAVPPGVEAVRRRHPDGRSYLFLVNHTEAAASIPAQGLDLWTGTSWPGPVTVPAGEVVVLRETGVPAPASGEGAP